MTTQQQQNYTVDSEWQEKFANMIVTPAKAVSRIAPGQRVFIGTGCATPQMLVKALVDRGSQLADIEIVHLLTFGEAPYAEKSLIENFRVNSFFISENVRDIIQEGLGDYTPIFLSDIPRLFSSGKLPLDVVLLQITPPDERGMCSLGVSVDIVKSAAENAALVIGQVNRNLPRTLGDSFLQVQDLDMLVIGDEALHEVHPPAPNDATRMIGEYVAALVDDGSTLELGIGEIPQAVMEFLATKKDLGLHTEMFTDKIIDMIESGVITGSQKTLDRGKVVASFCLGTKRLYDYIDCNPTFSFRPTEYVNDPFVISRQKNMVAINVALEVDLTGQICADSIGTKFFSGIGGQVDFNRGAARSEGGRAIIALPSTAKDGTISRIVCQLSPGAGVVTTRGDVQYVVTEYGAVYLHGKSVQERSLALISIAHPDFREQLLRDAIEAKYVRPELAGVGGQMQFGRTKFSATQLLTDGTQVNYRPIRPTDEPLVKDLFYHLSQQTIYYRFMKEMKIIPAKQVQEFVYINHRDDVAIVATLPEAHGEDIIGIGRYYLDKKTNRAEVAFVVRDQWQNHGIGTFLLRSLMTVAKRNGIAGFTAEVLRANKAMQAVLNVAPCKVQSELKEGLYHFDLDFA